MTLDRRIVACALLVASLTASGRPAAAQQPSLSARQIVERIKSELKGNWTDDRIDGFKDGDPDTPITGVAVTMMATMDVLQRAAAGKMNLVITHEPTFYAHEDRLTTLEEEHDSVTAAKRAFIREHHLVVWRLHDHWHFPARNPDPVVTGIFRALDWQRYQRTPEQNPIVVPVTTVGALASDIRKRLGVRTMRVVGDSALPVTKVGFLPGFPGFALQRGFLQRDDVEVLVMGEAHEWETILYAADAVTQGRRKALIVLGHIPSEQAGSEELVRWLQPMVPEVPVRLVTAAEPFWSPRD
jgi:putative NIF3 family GTP cyclohydrolase 1 type 2